MNKPGVQQSSSSLEVKIASELRPYLEQTVVGSSFKVEPSSDLCYLLELYIPQLLSSKYSEWESETLDGIFFASLHKAGARVAKGGGLCILMSDQTMIPFFVQLTLSSSYDSITSYRVFLGELGGGSLGISGQPCSLSRRQKLLEDVGARLEGIRWSYSATSDAN